MSNGNSDVRVWNAGIYRRFRIDDAPEHRSAPLCATACRNERVPFQLAVFPTVDQPDLRAQFTPLTSPDGAAIPHTAWDRHFVDYVHTSEQGPVSDRLSNEHDRDIEGGRIQPMWLTLHVPRCAEPGTYEGQVTLLWGDDGAEVLPVSIDVLDAAMPDPKAYRFYLDLWQHPAAVARYHRVDLWSDAHWTLLHAYNKTLAGAGQKPITTCIIHDPWASQTYDPHASMVGWMRHGNGTYRFDFTQFDRYVETCRTDGFTGPIACYSVSMGPGDRMDCPIRYFDMAAGRFKRLEMQVGDDTYRAVWKTFFDAFIPHLRERGWLDQVCIGIDEAPSEKMKALLDVVPYELKIGLAGNYHTELDDHIHDYCVIYPGPPEGVPMARRAQDRITTFYTCCGPAFPNTFTFSPPIESRLLAWHALQCDADGYLRWAFNSWSADPVATGDFGRWPAGDTYLAYPGPASSVRFELLKAGIQDFELVCQARDRRPEDPRLAEALKLANAEHDGTKADPDDLIQARALVHAVVADIGRAPSP